MNRVWQLEKAHKGNKLSRIAPGVPDNFQGVKLGDSTLEEEYGEPIIEPIILGNIEVSENVKAFCRLPLKYRLFPVVTKKANKVQGESRATKERWSLRDMKQHPGESFETRSKRLESENWERQPDKGGGRVDFTDIRVTQLQFNKLIHMPEAGSWSEEVTIMRQQLETLEVIDDYIMTECDSSGKPFESLNLTKMEALGRKEILEGVKSKKYLLYGTDKSEKLVLDTPANFMNAMAPHIRDHFKVSLEEVENSEKVLNNHSKMWCKITNIGKNAGHNQHNRIVGAMQSHSSGVPQYKGLRKDHKAPDPVLVARGQMHP